MARSRSIPAAASPPPTAITVAIRTRAHTAGHGTGTTERTKTAAFVTPVKSARQVPASASAKSPDGRRVSAYAPAASAPTPVRVGQSCPVTSPSSIPPNPASAPRASAKPSAAAPPTTASTASATVTRRPGRELRGSTPSAPIASAPSRPTLHQGSGSGGGSQSRVPRTSIGRSPSRSGTTQSRTRCGRSGAAVTWGGGDSSSQRLRWSCQRTTGSVSIRRQDGGRVGSVPAGSAVSPARVRFRYVAGEVVFS
ncbi:hypothetical protein GCM10027615_28200 [Plantactinospora veratri]